MEQETKFVQEQPKQKKISFFAAMLIVMGGSIGAGIFFKSGSVLSSSHGSLVLAIFCWLIASCAVISMALALIEVASVRNDNLSLIGWSKVFNSRRIYKASKDFMVYIYLPLTYFFMPLYVIMSLQDGLGGLINASGDAFVFGTEHDWLIWTVISLAMTVYFLTIPTLWSKIGDNQNKVVLAVKFIPLVFVTIIGFVLAFAGKGGQGEINALVQNDADASAAIGSSIQKFGGIGAGLGVFLAITAIFFAYDGFYVASGIQSEMKEPKKTPLALFIGLGVTTLIYVTIAISMSINGGSFFGMQDYMKAMMGDKVGRILFGLVNLCIAIGVLGIINGFSMWAPRYVEDLLAEGELPFWQKAKGKLNPNFPKFGVIYSLALTLPIVLLFTVIGAFAYLPGPDYSGYYTHSSGDYMARLYYFADLMANWTALFTFTFIAFAIMGAIRNRKTQRVKIEARTKYFLPFAYTAVILVLISLFVSVLVPIIDVFMLAAFDKDAWIVHNLNGSIDAASLGGAVELPDVNTTFKELLIGRVALVVVLFIYLGLSFLPLVFEDIYAKNKYGSVAKFEQHKKEQLAKVGA